MQATTCRWLFALLLLLLLESVHGWNSYIETLSKPPPKPKAATTTTTSKKKPQYNDFPLDRYLGNPHFHHINTNYPGIQLIHEEPYIFIVNNFLNPDECARLRAKATTGNLREQVGGGAVERTSTGVVCTNEEVPSIRAKMMQLLNVADARQLQYLKVSRYQEGQTFSKHTDAWPTEGAPVARGWVNEADFFGDLQRSTVGRCLAANHQANQNTLLTTFVYLNDVVGSGYTSFPNIGIHENYPRDVHGPYQSFYEHPTPMDSRQRPDGSPWDWDYRTAPEPLRIEPQQGLAVLHFCSTIPASGGICDGNTFHVAEPPALGGEKYVAQQFVASCTEWVLPEDSIPHGRVSWDTI